MTIWDCRTHVRMTSMTSSVERTDLDFKISVAVPLNIYMLHINKAVIIRSNLTKGGQRMVNQTFTS